MRGEKLANILATREMVTQLVRAQGLFAVGDPVKVTGGEHEGEVGTVKGYCPNGDPQVRLGRIGRSCIPLEHLDRDA